ncbi:MAG: hypothetical protein OXR62_16225 [Ahrensia sp.]|nr:hypothetical protein [Ahrensia sp.]
MIQLFEKSLVIRLILVVGVLVAIAMWIWIQPTTNTEWIRLASATVAFTAVGLGILAASPLWRIMWWVVRPLNWWIFPDLNGEWQVVMRSNIGKLAEFHPDLKGVEPRTEITGTITIKQSLLGIVLVFRGDDKYSNSETTFVKVVRTKGSGRFKLAYVYENDTPTPLKSDEQRHFGAGQLEVFWVDGDIKLEGLYWTNRRWADGLNTAGTITMARNS